MRLDEQSALDKNGKLARLQHACKLHQNGEYQAAEQIYQQILAKFPQDFDALHLMGILLHQQGDHSGAIHFLLQALHGSKQHAARNANVYNALGCAFQSMQQYKNAEQCFRDALACEAEMAEALNNLGVLLATLGRVEESMECYQRAIDIEPDKPDAQHNMAVCLAKQRRFKEAIPYYKSALGSGKHFDNMEGEYVRARMNLCEWEGLSEDFERIRARIRAGERIIEPYFFLPMPGDAHEQRRCAEIYVDSRYPSAGQGAQWRAWQHPKRGKIRVAYCSADFRDHPVAHLLRGVFELHDKSRFETYAFAYGPPAFDEMRHDLETRFDQFINISAMSDQRVEQLASNLEIDIAVDLAGHTTHSRTAIFARRMAPLQVNYLGFPGTLGAEFYDYIVGDNVVIRQDEAANFSEKAVAWLPHSCQPNDQMREISSHTPERALVGLPEKGFVFCCFNNSYKIGQQVFDIWMRLLHKVEGSVLWLSGHNDEVKANLQREAKIRGIQPERLVFSTRVLSMADHLARHRLADLFIDTFYFNAHSTASDALWGGLPLLTLPGKTYISRIAASLVNAVNLPELIARDAQDYENKALELALNPDRLQELKTRLEEHRHTAPLFNTLLYTRHLESAWQSMHERQLQDLPPRSFQVIPLATEA